MDPEHLLQSGRILLVAAHPDDEAIAAGGHLARWRDRIVLLHATDGAPLNGSDAAAHGFETTEDYARVRREELLCAVGQAGILPDQCRQLGFSDQATLWRLPQLTEEIAHIIDEVRPAWVLTHPYEGGHPDHDSCAFACRAALQLTSVTPCLVEFASYHAGPTGLITGEFLHSPEVELAIVLDQPARALKRRMFDCHRSQQHVLQYFRIDVERFRNAPDYDFTLPPHQGRLHYESLNWGIGGALWRDQAKQVMEESGLHNATYGS